MISGIFRSVIWSQTIPDHLRGRLAGFEMPSYSTGPLPGQIGRGRWLVPGWAWATRDVVQGTAVHMVCTIVRMTTATARRFDPQRKSRIVDATIDVIAEHGVAGTTHRRIAAAADVPLGSLTYHFTGLDDLFAHAFERHAERMSPLYEAHFEGVRSRADLIEAVADLIHGDAGADTRDWAIAYELYLAALKNPALRSITESWMRRSRAVLERYVDPVTARGVDALIEGLVMHMMLATSYSRADTRRILSRLLQEDT